MRDGPAAGLALIDGLVRGQLDTYPLATPPEPTSSAAWVRSQSPRRLPGALA